MKITSQFLDCSESEEVVSEGPSEVIVYDDFDSNSNEVIVDSSEFSEESSGLESVEIVEDDCDDKLFENWQQTLIFSWVATVYNCYCWRKILKICFLWNN